MTSLQREMEFNNEQRRTENIALHIDNDRLRQALQQANADNQQLRAENSVLRASPHTNPSTLPPMSAATSVTTPWSSSAGACTHIHTRTCVRTCASASSLPCARVREHVPVRVHVLVCVSTCLLVHKCCICALCCVHVRRQGKSCNRPSFCCACRTDYFQLEGLDSFPCGHG